MLLFQAAVLVPASDKASLYHILEFLLVHRLEKITESAEVHGLLGIFKPIVSTDKNNFGIDFSLPQFIQKIESAHGRHADIA